jgi:hypothetical protein
VTADRKCGRVQRAAVEHDIVHRPCGTTTGGVRWARALVQASLNPPGRVPAMRAIRSRLANRLVTTGTWSPWAVDDDNGVPVPLLELEHQCRRKEMEIDRVGDPHYSRRAGCRRILDLAQVIRKLSAVVPGPARAKAC